MSDSEPSHDENTYRFLFSSSAHFVGQAYGVQSNVEHCFPTIGSKNGNLNHQPGPYSRCYFILSVKFPPQDKRGNCVVIETYHWLGDMIAPLLSCIYGKLIQYHGQIQCGDRMTMPDISSSVNVSFAEPPFNNNPRSATDTQLNFDVLENYLSKIIFSKSDQRQALINAGIFYQVALENWRHRPDLAYSSLISSLETVLDLREYSDTELFDETRLRDFKKIEALEGGDKIVKRLRGSLYSIRRKFAIFVSDKLPEQFFSKRECNKAYGLLKSDNLEKAMKSAYDLRSKFLHTGNSEGFWALSYEGENLEIPLPGAMIEDKKMQKLVTSAVSLRGLERITSAVLSTLCCEYLKGDLDNDDNAQTR